MFLVCAVIYAAYPRVLFELGARVAWAETIPIDKYLLFRPRHSRSLLLERLRNGAPFRRAAAAHYLRVIPDPRLRGFPVDSEAVDALKFAAINDSYALVRQFAVASLAIAAPDALYEVRERLLGDVDPNVRWVALRFAVPYSNRVPRQRSDGIDPKMVRTLASIAKNDPEPFVRRFAIQNLRDVAPDAFYEILELLLLDPDPGVRWMALGVAALGGTTVDPRATSYLIRALTDPDHVVRGYVYERLCANTGQSFPYDPNGTIEAQREAQAVWQAWWDARQPKP